MLPRMKALLRATAWPAILAVLSGCSGGAALPTRVSPPSPQSPFVRSCSGWHVVASANPNSTNARFYDVDGDAAADIWAVGDDASSSSFRTLAERWNGDAWNI